MQLCLLNMPTELLMKDQQFYYDFSHHSYSQNTLDFRSFFMQKFQELLTLMDSPLMKPILGMLTYFHYTHHLKNQ